MFGVSDLSFECTLGLVTEQGHQDSEAFRCHEGNPVSSISKLFATTTTEVQSTSKPSPLQLKLQNGSEINDVESNVNDTRNNEKHDGEDVSSGDANEFYFLAENDYYDE